MEAAVAGSSSESLRTRGSKIDKRRSDEGLRIHVGKYVQPVAYGVDVEHRATAHDEGFVSLVEEPAYEGKGLGGVFPGVPGLGDRRAPDEMMGYGRELFLRRNGRAYPHFLIDLS